MVTLRVEGVEHVALIFEVVKLARDDVRLRFRECESRFIRRFLITNGIFVLCRLTTFLIRLIKFYSYFDRERVESA